MHMMESVIDIVSVGGGIELMSANTNDRSGVQRVLQAG